MRKGRERCLTKRQLGHWRDGSCSNMALSHYKADRVLTGKGSKSDTALRLRRDKDVLCCLVGKACWILCDSTDCSLPGFSVCGISQSRILERVAISSSRGSS